jgi:anaerobic carbon-monoxide dehydrogenase iron sulfur subunit
MTRGQRRLWQAAFATSVGWHSVLPKGRLYSDSVTKVLHITADRCTGCLRCELACSEMQTGTFQPAKSVIRVAPLEAHTSYAPYTCFQCAEAWCMAACPVDAITIAADTEAKVVIDDRCTGCKLCTIACPYGTMFLDLDRHKAFKCNLCGGDPACAKACPTQAIEWTDGPVQDWLGAFAEERGARDLLTIAGVNPQ